MDIEIEALFDRYERYFNQALRGKVDMADILSLYATEVIGAGPGGVRAAKNDEEFREYLAQGYDRYRAMGMTEIRRRNLRFSRIDDPHCVAHVAWSATYSPKERPDKVMIGFDMHYLIHVMEKEPKIFGWVSGDEQALLKSHGIV